jgi:hypothetical protein
VILEGNRDGGEIESALNGLNPATDRYVLRLALSIKLIVRRSPRALAISELSKAMTARRENRNCGRGNLPKPAPSDYYLATVFPLEP